LYLKISRHQYTKGVIRSDKWKDKQYNGPLKKSKRKNNDLQSTTQKTRNRAKQTPLNHRWTEVIPKGMQYVVCYRTLSSVMTLIGLYRITMSNFKYIILEIGICIRQVLEKTNDRQEEFEDTKGVIRIRI
jgi:hypothetical protein